MHVGIDASRCQVGEATGVERYSALLLPPLVRRLKEGGHAVTLYARTRLSGFSEARVRVLADRRMWTHRALGPVSLRDHVDVLFIPSHVMPLFLRPRRCVVVLHDACFELTPDAYAHMERWYLRLTSSSAIERAEVLTHSQTTVDILRTLYASSARPITVVPPAAIPVSDTHVPLPWPKPFLLFLGRLETRKNVVTLLQAFEKLLQKRPDLPHVLVLLGTDGHGAETIHAAWERLAVRDRVVLHGYANDDLRDAALRSASGVIVPSICEGSSLVLLEARSVRVPFISSALPVCEEAGGKEGIFVSDPLDVSEWVQALAELIDAPKTPLPAPRRSWNDVAADIAKILTAPKVLR